LTNRTNTLPCRVGGIDKQKKPREVFAGKLVNKQLLGTYLLTRWAQAIVFAVMQVKTHHLNE
jgi:hypothetical protein